MKPNLLSEIEDSISIDLKQFGLNEEESKIFLYLLKEGDRSALEVSRSEKIPRTRVYRILDRLIEAKLVRESILPNGRRFAPVSAHQIEYLVQEKEYELEKLKKSKDDLLMNIAFLSERSTVDSKILNYKGLEGLKQVTWNTTKAVGKLRLFEVATMSEYMDFGFAEKVRKEFVKNRVKAFELTNIKNMPAWTKIQKFVDNYWEIRYIEPKELKMNFEIVLYNEVSCMYGYKDKKLFCIEIYNEDLANMQKQLFDFMWAHGQKMTIGKGGEAKLLKNQ